MGRIRTIKPEFFLHEELYDLEQESGQPVRLAFAGLWCHVDREGRFKWRPRQLGVLVLPYDSLDFEAVLDALSSIGCVIKYEVDGVVYGCIPSWNSHQAVNVREAESKIPAPDGDEVHVYARARIAANVSKSVRDKIIARDGNKCLSCGATDDLTVDHIIPRCNGGTHDESNLRTLCRPCNSARPVHGKALEDDIARARTCTHVNARGEGKGIGREQERNGKEHSTPPQAASPYCPDFLEFWGVYPKRIGKGKANKSWIAAVKQFSLRAEVGGRKNAIAMILEAARAFAPTPAGQAGRFCPLAETWLNQNRFEDDPAEWNRTDEQPNGTRPLDLSF